MAVTVGGGLAAYIWKEHVQEWLIKAAVKWVPWIWTRKERNLSGYWYSYYEGTNRQHNRVVRLYHIGNKVYGESLPGSDDTSSDHHFSFKGRVYDRYILAEWYDEKTRRHFGCCLFMISGGQKTLTGQWIGFTDDAAGQIHGGPWDLSA